MYVIIISMMRYYIILFIKVYMYTFMLFLASSVNVLTKKTSCCHFSIAIINCDIAIMTRKSSRLELGNFSAEFMLFFFF